MDTLKPEEQVSKSWVHEPERVAAEHAEKVQRYLKTAELPGFVGGLALAFLGRRVRGASGNAIAAMGATMALGAAGRAAYRVGPRRIRDYVAKKLPSPVPASERVGTGDEALGGG